MEHARRTGVEKFVGIGTICAYPKFDAGAVSRSATCGTATRRKPTRPTASRRRCCSSRARPTGSSTASTPSTCCRSTSTDRTTTSIRASSHVIPALDPQVRRGGGGGEPEVVCWGTGNATREFLFVEDCAEAIVLATERYDGERAGEHRRGLRDQHPRARRADRGAHRIHGPAGRSIAPSPTASRAGCLDVHARAGAVRLQGDDRFPDRPAPDDRVVPRRQCGARREASASSTARTGPTRRRPVSC